ncbi:MAG: family 10 glycosylhydrolase, partial [Verrucomicrobia bacterium]|nr:family 10 glycosylhydrolase [Verrucomicrobiota bacterium]
FNPYRALVKSPDSQPAANHVSKSRPELVRDYGKHLWLDPGEKDVQNHSFNVVLDVVKRYDVDGVHFDDYFYPYREKGMDFPDAASWKKSGTGGKLSRGDWRRENVNTFVERVHKSIRQTKPWVKFGISPFGIWRPGYPRQIQGLDAYEDLYGDARIWLINGWVDYLAPQLYWRIEPPQQSFPVLLKWWGEQNKLGRHLWAGINTAGTAKGGTSWPPEEILNQITITRRQTGVSGHVHWNMHSLLQNQSLVENLSKGLYAEPALIPATPWLDSTPPPKPDLNAVANGSGSVKAAWNAASGETVWLWLLQSCKGEKWSDKILPGDIRSHVFSGNAPDAIALSAVDRLGNASLPATLAIRN